MIHFNENHENKFVNNNAGKGGVGRPVRPLYVRTEAAHDSSSSAGEPDPEPETPVFFSPSMFSPRLYSDSPRTMG